MMHEFFMHEVNINEEKRRSSSAATRREMASKTTKNPLPADFVFNPCRVAEFDCPLCQCKGTVVEVGNKSDIKKRQAIFEKEFQKKKKDFEVSKKSGGTAKAPCRSGYPEMRYACACPSMRTFREDITSSTCKDCKARGAISLDDDGIPNYSTCKCVCVAGVFTMKEVNKLAGRRPRGKRTGGKG